MPRLRYATLPRIKIPFLSFLTLLLICTSSLANPVHAASVDLTVDSIWLEKAANPGQVVTSVAPGEQFDIVASVKNIGDAPASGYYLDVYYDSDYGRGGPDNIAPGEVQTWYVGPLTAQAGTHTTTWIVDPDNQIVELDEGNNQKEYTFTTGSETTNTTTTTTSSTASNSTIASTTQTATTTNSTGASTSSSTQSTSTSTSSTESAGSATTAMTSSTSSTVESTSTESTSTTTTTVTSNSTSYTTQLTSASASSYTVTFYTDPASGTVAADGLMKASEVTGTYSGGQRVHVIANPPSGYSFASWEANGVTLDNRLSQDTYMTVSNDGWLKAHFTGSSHMVAPTDLTVWRPSSGTWFVRHQDGSSWQQTWGTSGDKTLLGDVDGDGVKDLIIWRPSNGAWFVLKSSTGYTGYSVYGWGVNGDTPRVP